MCLFPVYWDFDKCLLQNDLIIQWSEESLEPAQTGNFAVLCNFIFKLILWKLRGRAICWERGPVIKN